jgi:hypothetical protein
VFRQNTHALFIFLKSYTHALLAARDSKISVVGKSHGGDGSGGIFEKLGAVWILTKLTKSQVSFLSKVRQ